MAIKPFRNSNNYLDSLASPGQKLNIFGNKGETTSFLKAALVKVNEAGYIIMGDHEAMFLINPTSYDEAKSANWAQNSIPGQSDPILQYVNGGPRTISFDALVTADTLHFSAEAKPDNNKSVRAIGDIAAKFFKTAIPNIPKSTNTQSSANNLDITPYLNYYRSMLYPEYDDILNPRKLVKSPPLLALFIGNTFSNIDYGNRISTNTPVFVLTNLRIKITKQLPNLTPMEAVVSFELIQYTLKPFGTDNFYQ